MFAFGADELTEAPILVRFSIRTPIMLGVFCPYEEA